MRPGHRTAIRLKRKHTDRDLSSLFSSPCLGQPDRSNLRGSVNHPWNRVVIHLPRLACHALHCGDRLLLCLVCKHRPGDDIADGKNSRHIRLPLGIRPDTAAFVQLDPCFPRSETSGVRLAADRDQHFLRLKLQFFIGLGRRKLDAVFGFLGRLHTGAEMKFEPLFLQQFLQSLSDILVEHRSDAREKLNHCHLRSQSRPDRAKLQPDRPAANHDHRLRRLAKRDRVVTAQHGLAIKLQKWETADTAAGGDQDPLGVESLR